MQPSCPETSTVAALTAPPIINQTSSTSPAPISGNVNEANLYNSIGHDSFIVDQWAYSNEAQHTAFPWAWDSVEFQDVPTPPDGWEGGSSQPVPFNTEMEYAPPLPIGQNFPQLPSEVLPVANDVGFEDATIIPNAPMAFAVEDTGTQPFAFEPEYASGLYDGQNFQDFCPEVLPAAAEWIADTTGSTNNPTQQLQTDGNMQREQMPKRFQCDYPGCSSKGFGRKYELQRHRKKHSRSQLFLCPVAGCRFRQPGNAFYRHDKLGCHMRACHPSVQIPPAVPPTQAQVGTQASMTSSVVQNAPAQISMQG